MAFLEAKAFGAAAQLSEGSLLGGHSGTIFLLNRGPKTEHFLNEL